MARFAVRNWLERDNWAGMRRLPLVSSHSSSPGDAARTLAEPLHSLPDAYCYLPTPGSKAMSAAPLALFI